VQDAQAFLGQPGVGFLSMLLIGALAGWIAERVTESNHGIITNILVGIAGSFVGGGLAGLLDIPVFGFFRTLAAAIVGAIVILYLWRQLRQRAWRTATPRMQYQEPRMSAVYRILKKEDRHALGWITAQRQHRRSARDKTS
jgi:uncharacterized membrane protein YeaQ/YmgE (transglycosylase-associated protein family)